MKRLLLVLLVLAPSAAPAGSATVAGDRWVGLQPTVDSPERHGPRVVSRTVRAELRGDRLHLDVAWEFEPGDSIWFSAPIAGPSVAIERASWDGRKARLHAVRRGFIAPRRIVSPTTLRIRASVPAEPRATLHLLAAPRGELRVVGAEATAVVGTAAALGDNRYWTGAEALDVEFPPVPPADPPAVYGGGIAVGLTLDDGAAEAQARVRIEPRRGGVTSVVVRHAGLGPDRRVTDAAGARVAWSDSELRLTWPEPRRAAMTVKLAWSTALPSTDEVRVALPTLSLPGAARTDRYVQVARRGDRELLPAVRGSSLARSALPPWATGLVAGRAEGTWGPRSVSGSFLLQRLTPARGPAAIVDVADIRGAVSADGRTLLRARYTVRADRAPALTVSPPPGWTLLSARVADQAALPQTDGAALRIPIPRSVESVDGLLAFPVELAWLSDGRAWSDDEERSLALPGVDAPVAVLRATVHLPPGYRARKAQPGDRRVESFSRGGEALFGFGEADERADQAQSLFQQAATAWQGNEFDKAEGYLDALEDLGGKNADVGRLRGNLAVATGKKKAKTSSEKRVQAQASARSSGDRVRYRENRAAAKKLAEQGDYEAAASAYKQALADGNKLAALDDDEDLRRELETEIKEETRALARKSGLVGGRGGFALERTRTSHAAQHEPRKQPTPWPSARDDAPAQSRLDPTGSVASQSGLTKFDYGDPAIDVWGRMFGLGASGYGRGAGGYGSAGGRSSGVAAPAPVLDVRAATRSVPIPTVGEAVRFQRLLLPAGELASLTLRARRQRRLESRP